MQKATEKHIGERMRYYQSIIDTKELQIGECYKILPESYIIFICTSDPFGFNQANYTFENICVNNHEIRLNDKSKKVILYTKGISDDINPELRDFLKYIEESTGAMAESSTGILTKETHTIVENIKSERGTII